MPNIARDIFKDFNQKNNILDCVIDNINLYKKSNKILIELTSPHKFSIKELMEFEEYLKVKFNVQKIEFNVKYSEKVELTLEKDWQDIVKYIAIKMPIVKPIIQESTISIENKTVSIILKTNTADFLKSYKVDKALERLLLNLYAEKYIIKCVENLDDEVIKNKHMYLENIEKETCKTLLENNKKTTQEYKKSEEDDINSVECKEESAEKTDLIIGRSNKIKENLVKIKDLSIDYGKVAIEGKVISKDTRELKTGKTLLVFNVYDGTSTITCKAFVDPDKKEKVIGRFEKVNRVKLQGNVTFDTYAKEITIMTNTLLELPDFEVSVRKDLAKDKRVELHMHTQMSQMDGITSATDLINRAASWGMKSIAITDHRSGSKFSRGKKSSRQNRNKSYIWCRSIFSSR